MKAGKFVVKWTYRKVYSVVFDMDKKKMDQNLGLRYIQTTCAVEDNGSVMYGYAKCVATDNFSRDKGRKLSLTRAMANKILSKEDKKMIWEAYRNMTNKPRW